MSLREYKDESHVGIVSGTGAQLQDAALARHRVKRRVLLELPGFLGLAAIGAAKARKGSQEFKPL